MGYDFRGFGRLKYRYQVRARFLSSILQAFDIRQCRDDFVANAVPRSVYRMLTRHMKWLDSSRNVFQLIHRHIFT